MDLLPLHPELPPPLNMVANASPPPSPPPPLDATSQVTPAAKKRKSALKATKDPAALTNHAEDGDPATDDDAVATSPMLRERKFRRNGRIVSARPVRWVDGQLVIIEDIVALANPDIYRCSSHLQPRFRWYTSLPDRIRYCRCTQFRHRIRYHRRTQYCRNPQFCCHSHFCRDPQLRRLGPPCGSGC
ncbi:hypothetical protein FPQ18DRAFT_67848 [Pyronema domesticum]|nr:hypothetical protein FPQ18DRAFT_67848 [Pyronema domesticum]